MRWCLLSKILIIDKAVDEISMGKNVIIISSHKGNKSLLFVLALGSGKVDSKQYEYSVSGF